MSETIRTTIFHPGAIWCIMISLSICHGLLCYECNNAKDHDHCRRIGRIRRCEKNQESCQTTERIDNVQGSKVKITKRCKQARACEVNYQQNNYTKPEPQCRYFKTISVCRCCCITDFCNQDTDTCTGVTNPRLLKEKRDPDRYCPNVTDFNNGEVTCDMGNTPGSVCQFRCSTFYDLHGNTFITCQFKDGKAGWSDEPPCCVKPCPPHASMDLIIAMDVSSQSSKNANDMIEFVKTLVSPFKMGSVESRIGVVAFHEKVIADNEILLSMYNKTDDLLRAIDNIKLDNSPSGTRTGQVLDHVNSVSLKPSNGNRKNIRDVLLLITTGKPVEEIRDPITTAKLMRDNGVQVITVGLGKRVDTVTLRGTAGNSREAIEVLEDLEGIQKGHVSKKILDVVCGNTCVRE